MKKYIVAFVMLFLASSFTMDAQAGFWNWRKHKRHHRIKRSERPPVGAPLDGGLLTILGAAGVAYYVTRRKKATS